MTHDPRHVLGFAWRRARVRRDHVSVPLVDGTPGLVGVDRDRDPERARERLEAGLDQVVGVRAVARPDVEGQLRVRGDGAEELLRELGVEAGDRDGRQLGVEAAERAARRCRSRTRRAPRPSARRRGRSGGCRCGRRAPRRAPGRTRSRRPRPCGGPRSRGRRSPRPRARCARGGRAARACGRGSRRPVDGETSPPSRSSVSEICVSRVLRSIFAVLRLPAAISLNPPLDAGAGPRERRLAVDREALGPRRSRRRAARAPPRRRSGWRLRRCGEGTPAGRAGRRTARAPPVGRTWFEPAA